MLSVPSSLLWSRIGKSYLLDAARISRAIEFTRFPIPEPDDQVDEEGSLARAANLIGQLGDPHYLQKANALYYEFDEVGFNKRFGCASDGFISAILLQQRFTIPPNSYPISERYIEWT